MVSIKDTPRAASALFFRRRFPGLLPTAIRSSPAIFKTPEF
jgi:hypothetical protein